MDENKIEDYYLEQLLQQVSFLTDSCNSYDKGNFAQAKMQSAIIRTLVKDPGDPKRSRTVSLLTHLNKKNTMEFYNTGFEAKNAKLNINLVGIATVPSSLPTLTKQFDGLSEYNSLALHVYDFLLLVHEIKAILVINTHLTFPINIR